MTNENSKPGDGRSSPCLVVRSRLGSFCVLPHSLSLGRVDGVISGASMAKTTAYLETKNQFTQPHRATRPVRSAAPPRRRRRAVATARQLIVVAHLAAEFCPVEVLEHPPRVLGPPSPPSAQGSVRRLRLDHVQRIDHLVAGGLVLARGEEALEERGLGVVDHRRFTQQAPAPALYRSSGFGPRPTFWGARSRFAAVLPWAPAFPSVLQDLARFLASHLATAVRAKEIPKDTHRSSPSAALTSACPGQSLPQEDAAGRDAPAALARRRSHSLRGHFCKSPRVPAITSRPHVKGRPELSELSARRFADTLKRSSSTTRVLVSGRHDRPVRGQSSAADRAAAFCGLQGIALARRPRARVHGGARTRAANYPS